MKPVDKVINIGIWPKCWIQLNFHPVWHFGIWLALCLAVFRDTHWPDILHSFSDKAELYLHFAEWAGLWVLTLFVLTIFKQSAKKCIFFGICVKRYLRLHILFAMFFCFCFLKFVVVLIDMYYCHIETICHNIFYFFLIFPKTYMFQNI